MFIWSVIYGKEIVRNFVVFRMHFMRIVEFTWERAEYFVYHAFAIRSRFFLLVRNIMLKNFQFRFLFEKKAFLETHCFSLATSTQNLPNGFTGVSIMTTLRKRYFTHSSSIRIYFHTRTTLLLRPHAETPVNTVFIHWVLARRCSAAYAFFTTL